jgi:hypothetical protein
MPQLPPDPARRQMLGRTRNVAAAGAALAVLGPVSAAPTLPAPAVAAPQEEAKARGYQDSERNRRYYQLARF